MTFYRSQTYLKDVYLQRLNYFVTTMDDLHTSIVTIIHCSDQVLAYLDSRE